MTHLKTVSVAVAFTVLTATACTTETKAEPESSASGKVPTITLTAGTSSSGYCQVEELAVVNKPETNLYNIFGEAKYVDMDTGETTRIPLQYVFRGWDDEGISQATGIVGLNSETSCDRLSIQTEVRYCIYDYTGGERQRCPEGLIYDGEGFGEILLTRGDLELPAYEPPAE